eukprot:symbB.v1.2.023226.t1/scaffold2109.1/size89064/3
MRTPQSLVWFYWCEFYLEWLDNYIISQYVSSNITQISATTDSQPRSATPRQSFAEASPKKPEAAANPSESKKSTRLRPSSAPPRRESEAVPPVPPAVVPRPPRPRPSSAGAKTSSRGATSTATPMGKEAGEKAEKCPRWEDVNAEPDAEPDTEAEKGSSSHPREGVHQARIPRSAENPSPKRTWTVNGNPSGSASKVAAEAAAKAKAGARPWWLRLSRSKGMEDSHGEAFAATASAETVDEDAGDEKMPTARQRSQRSSAPSAVRFMKRPPRPSSTPPESPWTPPATAGTPAGTPEPAAAAVPPRRPPVPRAPRPKSAPPKRSVSFEASPPDVVPRFEEDNRDTKVAKDSSRCAENLKEGSTQERPVPSWPWVSPRFFGADSDDEGGPSNAPAKTPSETLRRLMELQRTLPTLGSLVFLLGCWIQARAMSIAWMCLGRLISGCAVGLLSTVVALYQSEVAPAHMRGGLTSLYQFMITAGILAAAAADILLVELEDGWRYAICLQVFPALLLLLGMMCLPRSPRWLVQQGRSDEALSALLKLRDERSAREELKEIVASWEAIGHGGTWSDMPSTTKQVLAVGVTMQLLQQLENKFQALNNAVNCLATLPALCLADRCGRRCLLISGAIGMFLSCVIMALVGLNKVEGDLQASYLTISMIFLFVANFAYGWGPIVWVVCAEIFPLRYRSRCVGLTTMSNWVGNFLIAQMTPVLLESLGFGSFLVFAFFTLMALVLAFWIPETKNLPLEEIEFLFQKKLGAESAPRTAPRILGVETENSDLIDSPKSGDLETVEV